MNTNPFKNNRQPDDASREDELDQLLNTYVASDGPPDANHNHQSDRRDPDSLSASADAFHRRMETAHQHNPESSQPAPDLWGRILESNTPHHKEPEMSSAPLALDNRPQ